ncbi:hypothetical protein AKJ08_0873 [Vulgatibacter incomptus]|uniref:Uncharacterized protein n=1 Tax=Vulgatibacter incomptus TaxID=1391653 RepID=A0A0K1PAP9_9BACT|nr:hypothetical protein AKJ08_0873 [Vulgatibacter incomptus]
MKAANPALEKASEKRKDGKPKPRVDGGDVRIRSTDQSGITFQGKNGVEDSVGTAKVPEGFPLDTFGGARVVTSAASGTPGNRKYMVIFELPKGAEIDKVAGFYEKELKEKGVRAERNDFELHGAKTVSLVGKTTDGTVATVHVAANGEDPMNATVTWTPKGE